VHEFLRGRFVAATAIAVLQRHGATNLDRLFLPGIWIVDPQRERAVTPRQTFNDPLAAFAGRGFLANIDVAIAHDKNPFEYIATRGYSEKAADRSTEPAGAMLRVTVGGSPSRFSTRERLKIRPICRTRRSLAGKRGSISSIRLESLRFSGNCFVGPGRRNKSRAG
jgi:hypothetical protein